jgi:hypothetical protein
MPDHRTAATLIRRRARERCHRPAAADTQFDLMAWGLASLASSTKAYFSKLVTYARDEDFVELRAVLGRKLLKLSDGDGGVRMEWTDMDFLIDTTDLVLGGSEATPQRGDLVYLPLADTVEVFEVSPPDPTEPCWRWCDPFRYKRRIHAKHVDTESC